MSAYLCVKNAAEAIAFYATAFGAATLMLADEVIARMLEAGATLEIPPADQFYGKRSGCVRDPFGLRWNIGHPIEDVSTEEMQRRYMEMARSK